MQINEQAHYEAGDTWTESATHYFHAGDFTAATAAEILGIDEQVLRDKVAAEVQS